MKIFELHQHAISVVEGDRCKNTDMSEYFYIPDDGYLLEDGISGFLTFQEAKNALIRNLEKEISYLEKELDIAEDIEEYMYE